MPIDPWKNGLNVDTKLRLEINGLISSYFAGKYTQMYTGLDTEPDQSTMLESIYQNRPEEYWQWRGFKDMGYKGIRSAIDYWNYGWNIMDKR